jgi:hypothetical protein
MRFFRAWLFFVVRRIIRNAETQEWRRGISEMEGKAAMGSGEEATAATEFQKKFLFCSDSFFPAFLIQFFMTEGDGQLPNSRKVYVSGKSHPDIRVPFSVIPSEVEGSFDISVRL